MNTSVRARHDARGFSFVELLVTIIVAAIAFAALIPFFANAQSTNARENMRNIGMQVARDKVEKIRQLDYDSVDETYLYDNGPPIMAGQFGKEWVAGGAGSSGKQFDIKYDVDLMNADGTVCSTSTAGQEAYKVVRVYVKWLGAPLGPPATLNGPPAEYTFANTPIMLQTQISRQYFGPQIVDFTIPDADDSSEIPVIVAGGPIHVIATVATQDLAQMTGSPLGMGSVVFSVTDMNGNLIASGSESAQLNPSIPPGVVGQYQWLWDSTTASTGYYVFTAHAESGGGAAGNSWSRTYSVQSTSLPAPAPVSVSPGNQSALLIWGAVGGADHYEVWGGTTSNAELLLDDKVLGSLTTYRDTSLTNGTKYYYKVRAVGPLNKQGAMSVEVSCKPAVGADTTAPTAPSGLALSGRTDSGISFTWTASAGDPLIYEVWRSLDNAAWSQVGSVIGNLPANPPQASYFDNGLNANTQYWYQVRAVDAANNASGYSFPAAQFTTLLVSPKGSLTVTNNSNGQKAIAVTVYNMSNLQYYSANGTPSIAASTVTISNGSPNQAVWTSLPVGAYQVTATNSNKSQSQSPVSVTEGRNVSVSFAF